MSEELKKLQAFYKAVARLTTNHDYLEGSAVVFPKDLGVELEKIDKQWYKLDW